MSNILRKIQAAHKEKNEPSESRPPLSRSNSVPVMEPDSPPPPTLHRRLESFMTGLPPLDLRELEEVEEEIKDVDEIDDVEEVGTKSIGVELRPLAQPIAAAAAAAAEEQDESEDSEVSRISDSNPPILFISDSPFKSKKLRENLVVYSQIVELDIDVFRDKHPRDFEHLKFIYIDIGDDDQRYYLERNLLSFKEDGWFIFAIPRKKNRKWIQQVQPHICIHKKKLPEIRGMDLEETLKKMRQYLNVTKISKPKLNLFACSRKKKSS